MLGNLVFTSIFYVFLEPPYVFVFLLFSLFFFSLVG